MTDNFQVEAALGKLINLSGKMRMLSHRAVMAAMQIALLADQESTSLEIFNAAVIEFQEIAASINSGSRKLGIPESVARILTDSGAQSASIQEPIKRFVEFSIRTKQQINSGKLDAAGLALFSAFVANDLLAALNELNACVSRSLEAQLAAQRETEESARKAVLSAVQSISDVSMKVKLISLNASVEAARAGEHGRGFAVIAQEIRSLSEDAAASTRQITGHLQQIA